MSISKQLYRLVMILLGGLTLCANGLLLSGCENYPQRAAVVLLARSGDAAKDNAYRVIKNTDGTESVDVDFNWDKMTVGGISLSEFAKDAKAKQWRLNVFNYYTGERFPGGGDDNFHSITKREVKLSGLPLDTLLRADVDFLRGEEPDAEGSPMNFVVLFIKDTP